MVETKISDEVIKILDYIFAKFGIVVDWSSTELLPYIKELSEKIVRYKESIAWLWITVAAVFLVIFAIAAIVLIIKIDTDTFGFVCSIAVVIIALCIGMYNGHIVITCRTFPEKVVIEYLSEQYKIIKSNN